VKRVYSEMEREMVIFIVLLPRVFVGVHFGIVWGRVEGGARSGTGDRKRKERTKISIYSWGFASFSDRIIYSRHSLGQDPISIISDLDVFTGQCR